MGSSRNKEIPGTHLKEVVSSLKSGRWKEESCVLYHMLGSECSGSTMNDNGFSLLMVYLHFVCPAKCHRHNGKVMFLCTITRSC